MSDVVELRVDEQTLRGGKPRLRADRAADAAGGAAAAGGRGCAGGGASPMRNLTLTEWLSVWAAVGHGIGAVTVTPEGKPELTADLALTMGAAGLRNGVVRPPADGVGAGGQHSGGAGSRSGTSQRL